MARFRLLLLAALVVTTFGCGGGGGGGGGGIPPADKTSWTVLVYMNAANDLSAFDALNVNQMEQVADNPNVRFVVQWKQVKAYQTAEFVGTRRYLVKPDNTSTIKSEVVQDMGQGVDMGLASTLHDFVEWGRKQYPADRYCLVLWDHGNGWDHEFLGNGAASPMSWSDDMETKHDIDTWEMTQAINGYKWDIVSWDASLMQMMEVAYQIKGQASYVVGSEESPPAAGLPYQLVFKKFRDNPDALTAELAKAFVDGMMSVPAYAQEHVTQSVVDTSKLDGLRDSLSTLANSLIAHRSDLLLAIPKVRDDAKGFSVSANRHYYDIGDLCDKIDANIDITDIQSATQAVRNAYGQAIVYERHNTVSAGSSGLSIDFSKGTTFNAGPASRYSNLTFALDSTWDDWLSVAP